MSNYEFVSFKIVFIIEYFQNLSHTNGVNVVRSLAHDIKKIKDTGCGDAHL